MNWKQSEGKIHFLLRLPHAWFRSSSLSLAPKFYVGIERLFEILYSNIKVESDVSNLVFCCNLTSLIYLIKRQYKIVFLVYVVKKDENQTSSLIQISVLRQHARDVIIALISILFSVIDMLVVVIYCFKLHMVFWAQETATIDLSMAINSEALSFSTSGSILF